MLYEYACQVFNVHDGDTVDCIIDLGMRIQKVERIRLWGINAAELSTGKPGLTAKEALRLLVIGKPLIIRTIKDKDDKYGRLLGVFFEKNSDRSVNQKLLDQGLAVPFMVKMNGDRLPDV